MVTGAAAVVVVVTGAAAVVVVVTGAATVVVLGSTSHSAAVTQTPSSFQKKPLMQVQVATQASLSQMGNMSSHVAWQLDAHEVHSWLSPHAGVVVDNVVVVVVLVVVVVVDIVVVDVVVEVVVVVVSSAASHSARAIQTPVSSSLMKPSRQIHLAMQL